MLFMVLSARNSVESPVERSLSVLLCYVSGGKLFQAWGLGTGPARRVP